MDSTNDPIKALLEKTGLSCDDLLQKLLQYKTQQSKDINESKQTDCLGNFSGDTTDHNVNTTPVISTKLINSDIPESNNDVSSNSNENVKINGLHNQQVEQAFEESDKESRPSETTTENFSSDVEHKEEASRIDLKNRSCELKENPKTSLSIPSTGSENNKEIDVETKASNRRENQEEVLHKSISQNRNDELSSIERHTSSNEKDIVVETKTSNRRENQEEVLNKSISQNRNDELSSIEKHTSSNDKEIDVETKASNRKENQEEVLHKSISQNRNDELSSIERHTSSNDADFSSELKEPYESDVINTNNSENKETSGSTSEYSEKHSGLENEVGKINSSQRKSISDELVRKLTNRLEKDDNKITDQPERSDKINNNPEENDIEVCHVEDMEVAATPAKPLLKLRSDLFANDCKGNFHLSDNEDENEENDPEIREFLKNVEEVTGEVKISRRSPLTTSEDLVRENTSRFRRVKLGFVKKRILHKAIKCINESESRKNEHTNHNGIFIHQEKSNSERTAKAIKTAEEEIRENLKLQLSSLRNRKRTNNFVQANCTSGNLNSYQHIYGKKKATSAIIASTSRVHTATTNNDLLQRPLNYVENAAAENINSEIADDEEALFSLSKDTDFKIINVQGGVEFSEPDAREEKDRGGPSDLIKLTKTNDVTKIKGWQNKKFQLQQVNNQKDLIKKLKSHTKEINESDNQKEILEEKNKKKELSPFVSNSLEEFLTENSTLNISYNIPKLGAEEGINTQKYNTVIIPQTTESTTSETERKEEAEKEKPKSIKPKTLAEKRRMLESNKSKLMKDKNAFDRTSYVLYNGHKLYVPTTSSEECLANIKFSPKLNIDYENYKLQKDHKLVKSRKLSLLDIYHQNSTSVSYKPGPLRKKIQLQNKESVSEWDTEIRRLPTIKLNVIPEIGKPIPPHLEHFFNFGPIIKEDRLELAMSAVLEKPKEKGKKQGFSLTIPYANNQKYILVRKRKKIDHNIIYDIPPEKNTVKSILDDIISYVENKENEELILRDAEVYEDEDHDENVISSATEVNLPKKTKRRKLDSELLRLSCKVLSVSVDETEENKSMCKKSFCNLGCVCKSLTCAPRLPMHCSKVECMFDCKCSTSRNISLDGESGTLSCDTVCRLEDQAKKNLARVEKEFTQTLIHANDKTILIPFIDRKKTKRIKRIPKRYSDFLDDFSAEERSNSALKDNQENFTNEITDCYVQLNRLNMKGVIPLCLYHDCYNCSCMNSQDKKSSPISDIECIESAQNKVSRKRKFSSIEKKKPSSESTERSIGNSAENSSDSDYMEELRIVDTRKFKEKGGCARAFGVHPEVLARNEIPFYKNKLRSKVAQAENSTFIDTSSIKNIIYNEPETEFVDVTKPLMISASDRMKIFITSKQKKKRKQISDESDNLSNKAKKLKRKLNESVEEAVQQNKNEENLPYTPVFNGEIIVPTNENKEFVKKLGVKSAARFMRLLPWDDLLKNYYNKKINIWCPNNSNNKLLMNVNDKGPPPGYIEITESKRKNGIMNWILSKQLPKNTPSELVHLILSPKNEYFEISGICLKNITEEERSKKYIREHKSDEIYGEPLQGDSCNISTNSKFFKHKNHANEENMLAMSQKVYKKQDLTIVSSRNEITFISAELPLFESSRWRMVFLNSNFSFLSFMRSNYSIKYTDLKNILKMAQDSNKTIFLQSDRMSQGYSQKSYGIYAVPNFNDNLFIGPYAYHEDHDLQTLRYLRQELVPTEFFEMVQGGVIPNKKKDVWLIPNNSPELKKEHLNTSLNSPIQSSKHVTEDSEYAVLTPLPSSSKKSLDIKTFDSQSKTNTAQQVQYFHSHVLDENAQFTTSMDLEHNAFVKFPQFTILNGKKMRLQDYNCYLITNVPDIGYLGAVKVENSSSLEVDWPFGNKVLRFVNVLCAMQFVRRRFMNLLLPVPATFNLRIILKEDIVNLKYISPVDPKSLNGTHICGSFGIMDSRKLTPQLALSLGTTQEEVLQRLAKRAQFLGNLEIDKLKETEKILIGTKKELIMKKQNNLKKYMDLLMDLPEERRVHEYSKFRQLFNNICKTKEVKDTSEKPKSGDDVECIEIEDSDSEANSSLEIVETSSMEHIPKTPSMKSILKPNINAPMSPPSSSDAESCRPVENFKLVKTSSGKLILVKDNSGAFLSKTLSGMKLKIKNNRVLDEKL